MNNSLLNGGNFRFSIEKAPNLSFFVNSVILPSIFLQPVNTENPFTTIPLPGDHLYFDPLVISFLVDEDLRGYIEVYSWMRGLGFPTDFREYSDLVAGAKLSSIKQETTSDITLMTMTGSRNTNVIFDFIDAFPTNLTAPRLETSLAGASTLTCEATFHYSHFNVRT